MVLHWSREINGMRDSLGNGAVGGGHGGGMSGCDVRVDVGVRVSESNSIIINTELTVKRLTKPH